MEYLSVEEGRAAPGLRLILTAGSPGPWGEAAKYLFQVKQQDFLPVRQEGGEANTALRDWTGQTSAPVAVFNDEEPRTHPDALIWLAERLNPEPALVPEDLDDRAAVFGIVRHIAGEQGFGWQRRLRLFAQLHVLQGDTPLFRRLADKYGFNENSARRAATEIPRLLHWLAEQLRQQAARGSHYFVGDTLSAADLYWAAFSNMLVPLPPEQNPMPDGLRSLYALEADSDGALSEEDTAILLRHRDAIYATHLSLPLDF